MIKKYSKSKMFAIALAALCLYEVPVFAKSGDNNDKTAKIR